MAQGRGNNFYAAIKAEDGQLSAFDGFCEFGGGCDVFPGSGATAEDEAEDEQY